MGQKKKSIVNQLHSDFYLEKLVNNEISKFIVQNQPLSQWMKDSQKRKKKRKKKKKNVSEWRNILNKYKYHVFYSSVIFFENIVKNWIESTTILNI